jgi:PilZ domain
MRRVEFHNGEPALSNDGHSGKDQSGTEQPGKDQSSKDQSSKDQSSKEYQRRFSRYPFDVRIQVSVFRDGTTTELWGRTSELGQDGLGATLSGGLQLGEVVSLEFPIPLPPHLAKIRAVVRYSEGLRCGFEFLVVPEAQKLILRQVCVVLANAS